MPSALERVADPADPRRCKAASVDGQCMNRAEHGAEYCRVHGGRSTQKEEDFRSYMLARVEDRIRLAQLSDHLEPVKALRDSVALQHMLIERRYNLIQNDADLMSACGAINQMLLTMERLLTSAHRLEQSLGALLSRDEIMRLAKFMIEVVIDELQGVEGYEEIVDRIADRLLYTIQNNRPEPVEVKALPAP